MQMCSSRLQFADFFYDLPMARKNTDNQTGAFFFSLAPDTRAGGGAPAMESRLSTLATCGLEVRTSLEATTG